MMCCIEHHDRCEVFPTDLTNATAKEGAFTGFATVQLVYNGTEFSSDAGRSQYARPQFSDTDTILKP